MDEFLALIYLFFVRPQAALAKVKQGTPWWWSVAVFAGVYLLGQGLDLATGPDWPEAALPRFLTDPGVLGRVQLFLGLPAAFALWFLTAAVWHLLAQLLGGRGGGRAFFLGLGFTQLPLLAGQTAGGVCRLLGWGAGWTVFLLAASGWVLLLQYLAVREVHGLSVGRALGVMVLPFIFVACFAFLSLVLLASFIPVEMLPRFP